MRLLRLSKSYCDRTVLLLLRTFVDVIALRKGPEHIPHSWLLLALTLLSLLFAFFCVTALGDRNYALSLFTSALGIGFYAVVVIIAGYYRRLVQTLTTVMGCGAILTMLFVAVFVLLRPLLGQELSDLVALLILFWSVFVDGHIMARAMGRHLFAGVAVAIVAFALQYVFQLSTMRT